MKMKIQSRVKKIERKSHTRKMLGLLLMSLLSLIIIMPNAMAHCPLCTAATIVGVGVTRSLGWEYLLEQ